MLVEAVAAALVGLLALFVVLRPLIWPPPPAEPVLEPLEQEETPRGVALLALKEIDFDRETGKLSDEDYHFLKEKYTAQALEALRAEEGERASDDVEAMIASCVKRPQQQQQVGRRRLEQGREIDIEGSESDAVFAQLRPGHLIESFDLGRRLFAAEHAEIFRQLIGEPSGESRQVGGLAQQDQWLKLRVELGLEPRLKPAQHPLAVGPG